MINGIELSPSNKAKCVSCGKTIGKGTPRGIEEMNKDNYTSARYYCHKCTIELIEWSIENQKELLKDFKKLIKKNPKVLILDKLEGLK